MLDLVQRGQRLQVKAKKKPAKDFKAVRVRNAVQVMRIYIHYFYFMRLLPDQLLLYE